MKEPDYEQLTLFQEDFPASRSQLPGSAEARKTTASSGQRCAELYKNSGQLGCLVKMLLGSSAWRSPQARLAWKAEALTAFKTLTITKRYYHDKRTRCSSTSSKTLSISATKSNRLLFRLVPSVPRTEETDASSLPTFPTPTRFDATCGDLKGKEYKEGSRHAMKLIQAAQAPATFWPTPTVMDSKGLDNYKRKDATSTRSILLSQKVQMFPTPTAHISTGPSNTKTRQGAPDLQTFVIGTPTATGSKRSARFGGGQNTKPGGDCWWSAEPGVGRVANGVPHRVERLRGLGNAVVPAQLFPIFYCIAQIDKT